MSDKIKKRLSELLTAMSANEIDYYLITSTDCHNSEYTSDYFKVREYFSGFTGSSGILLLNKRECGLWTDGRYFIQAEKELSGSGIKLFKMGEKGVPSIEEYLGANMRDSETLGFDGMIVTAKYANEINKSLSKYYLINHYNKLSVKEINLVDTIWKTRPQLSQNPVRILDKALTGEDTEEKLKRVRKQIALGGADALFLSALDDIMWLFNIRGSDIAHTPLAYAYALIEFDNAYIFLKKGAVTEELKKYAVDCGVKILDYDKVLSFLERTYVNQRKEIYDVPYKNDSAISIPEKQYLDTPSIMLDLSHTSQTIYKTLKQSVNIVNRQSPIIPLKAVKNDTEISNLKKIYELDSLILTKFIYKMKSWAKHQKSEWDDLTEQSAANCLDDMRKLAEGFLDLSFTTISAYGANAALAHYHATDKNNTQILRKGMYLVDSGGQYMGGTTDVTRTLIMGDITTEMRQVYTLVLMGMLNLSDMVFPKGCSGRVIDMAARQYLWKRRLDYNHSTGHGVGYMLGVHEGPQSISFRYRKGADDTELKAGMLVSCEPAFYKEGEFGIRIENILLCVQDEKDSGFLRFEALTKTPIDKDGLDKSLMSEVDIKRLNAYHAMVYDAIAPSFDAEGLEWLKESCAQEKIDFAR